MRLEIRPRQSTTSHRRTLLHGHDQPPQQILSTSRSAERYEIETRDLSHPLHHPKVRSRWPRSTVQQPSINKGPRSERNNRTSDASPTIRRPSLATAQPRFQHLPLPEFVRWLAAGEGQREPWWTSQTRTETTMLVSLAYGGRIIPALILLATLSVQNAATPRCAEHGIRQEQDRRRRR